jgi:predicted DNA-binding transcriptional regulator
MDKDYQARLEKWGLSPLEAQVYLALVSHSQTLRAAAVAAAAGIPRPSVYPVLESLVEKGMVKNGEGYGSEFAAIDPSKALPRLIAGEKEKLAERELLTDTLVQGLGLLARAKPKTSETELIEVLRDPRIRGERFQQLQREATREVDTLSSIANVPLPQRRTGNPALCQSLRRSIKHRVIYEPALLEHEYIAPYLKGWIQLGEEARVYKGHLPLRFALFDEKIAWMPLEVNAPRHPVVSLVIRHHALGQTLRLLFDYLWNESEPLTLETKGVQSRRRGKSPTTKK